MATSRNELKTAAKAAGTNKLKFSDPKGPARRRVSTEFLEARDKFHEELKTLRQPPKTAKDRTQVDRADLFLQGEVQSDPVKALRDRLTKMLVMEMKINDELYAQEVLDQGALSASNKRLIELGQALKALPSQSAGENKGTQRSSAEIIATEAAKPHDPAELAEVDELNTNMARRAADAFGDGT